MRALLIALVALFLAGCGKSAPFNATDISSAEFGRDFRLTDHLKQPRRLQDFRGKVVVMFFGYTQCPDVCPTNMSAMRSVIDTLGNDAERLQVLFVTIDPERDTAELLAQYVPTFHPSFIGLYGDTATTAATAKEFKVFYQKQPGTTPATYTVDHSAGSYVFDPVGHLRLYVKHGESPSRIAEDVRRLLAGE
jgi:protein SCO1/2